MKQLTKVLLLTAAGIIALVSTAAFAAKPMSEEFKNATFTGIYKHPVTLKGGRWEGEPFVPGGVSRPSVGLVNDFYLSGDLSGDGASEQVVMLWENSGGSGTRTYLAVMGNNNNKLVNISTGFIGDRVQLRAGHINNGRIELDVIQAGPDEPACCPSQKATRSWSLDGKDLQEGKIVANGKLSLADLEGVEWVLTSIGQDENLPDTVELTLRFDGENIEGRSACNSYFAGITESADIAGDISIGPIGSTRMACPPESMTLEQSYFAALEGTSKFGFLIGKLVLSWTQGDQVGSMLFVPRKIPSK